MISGKLSSPFTLERDIYTLYTWWSLDNDKLHRCPSRWRLFVPTWAAGHCSAIQSIWYLQFFPKPQTIPIIFSVSSSSHAWRYLQFNSCQIPQSIFSIVILWTTMNMQTSSNASKKIFPWVSVGSVKGLNLKSLNMVRNHEWWRYLVPVWRFSFLVLHDVFEGIIVSRI